MLPPHQYPQEQITAVFADVIGLDPDRLGVLARVHENAGVGSRYLSLPLEQYATLSGFEEANDAYLRTAVELGERAVAQALAASGLQASDVDLFVSATVTGVAVPSIEARIADRMGMRSDVKRMPLFGLGCVAGAAGIARVGDYLRGFPGDVAVLLAVELCSLTVQRDDRSAANLVSSGLFGDGVAAVVLSGAEHALNKPPVGERVALGAVPRPRVVATRSRLYPDTQRTMGFDVGGSGLRVVLGVEVPELVRTQVRGDVDAFLADCGLTRKDIRWWVSHPGGPKVLEALQEGLEIDRDALAITWASLAAVGNLSSASVLHVLADTLAQRPPPPGSWGMLMAMGPGFCLETVLLRAE